jgi:hypothetical protein
MTDPLQPDNREVTEVPEPPAEGVSVVTVADKVRKWGMYLLLWAFLMTIGLSLMSTLFFHTPDIDKILKVAANDRELAVALAEKPFDHLKQILQIRLPAETALLGSAMGFYYGSQSKNSS